MIYLEHQYALWEEFLTEWPPERLARMTLDEYNLAGSRDTFTYWLESRLDKMGSIWGGSAFKFGVYSRKSEEIKDSSAKLSYSDTHGWYTALGSTAQEAFEKVRQTIVKLVGYAQAGDLDNIDQIDVFGDVVKWKIAFHYQDRDAPCIVDVFKPAMLAVFLGVEGQPSMAALQRAAIEKKPKDIGILEYGPQIWNAAIQKKIAILKISFNPSAFTEEQIDGYLARKVVVFDTQTKTEIKPGNVFYLCNAHHKVYLIGKITSQTTSCPDKNGWAQASYEVLKDATKTFVYTGAKRKWLPSGDTSVASIPSKDLVKFEGEILKPYFDLDLFQLGELATQPSEIGPPEQNDSTDFIGQTRTVQMATPSNLIYYGPPGTGKTHTLNQKKDAYVTRGVALSMDQWLPEQVKGLGWFEIIFMCLYDLGAVSKVKDIEQHPFFAAKARASSRTTHLVAQIWATLQAHTIMDSTTVAYKTRVAPLVFDKVEAGRWHLAGDWKEDCVDLIELTSTLKSGPPSQSQQIRYAFVTFHQAYSYEDFVEGIRPLADTETGEMTYQVTPGIFKEICLEAKKYPEQRFAIFIDEINRGNVAKIFGELITLIEPDKRTIYDREGGLTQGMELTLPYSRDSFGVPANLDIYGAMNTADRSIALLDTALRRRFRFKELMPIPQMIPGQDGQGHIHCESGLTIDLRRLLATMNQRITLLLNRDFALGHSYFWEVRTFEDLREVFLEQVIPLLQEHLYNDWYRIQLVFRDIGSDPRASVHNQLIQHTPLKTTEILGFDHEDFEDPIQYTVTQASQITPESFIKIYDEVVQFDG